MASCERHITPDREPGLIALIECLDVFQSHDVEPDCILCTVEPAADTCTACLKSIGVA